MFDIFNDFTNNTIISLPHELRAIYITNYIKNINKNIVVVTNSLFEANKLHDTIQNYYNETLLFPMDDFLTSEAIAVSPELKTKRLETLEDLLYAKKPRIIVTNLMGYLRILPPKETILNNIIKLKVNEDYNSKTVIERLFNNGYEKVSLVNKTGEFAVRGFVIDVFPLKSENPIRIEFWGDTIESIKEFDISNQRTIKDIKDISIFPNTEFIT